MIKTIFVVDPHASVILLLSWEFKPQTRSRTVHVVLGQRWIGSGLVRAKRHCPCRHEWNQCEHLTLREKTNVLSAAVFYICVVLLICVQVPSWVSAPVAPRDHLRPEDAKDQHQNRTSLTRDSLVFVLDEFISMRTRESLVQCSEQASCLFSCDRLVTLGRCCFPFTGFSAITDGKFSLGLVCYVGLSSPEPGLQHRVCVHSHSFHISRQLMISVSLEHKDKMKSGRSEHLKIKSHLRGRREEKWDTSQWPAESTSVRTDRCGNTGSSGSAAGLWLRVTSCSHQCGNINVLRNTKLCHRFNNVFVKDDVKFLITWRMKHVHLFSLVLGSAGFCCCHSADELVWGQKCLSLWLTQTLSRFHRVWCVAHETNADEVLKWCETDTNVTALVAGAQEAQWVDWYTDVPVVVGWGDCLLSGVRALGGSLQKNRSVSVEWPTSCNVRLLLLPQGSAHTGLKRVPGPSAPSLLRLTQIRTVSWSQISGRRSLSQMSSD